MNRAGSKRRRRRRRRISGTAKKEKKMQDMEKKNTTKKKNRNSNSNCLYFQGFSLILRYKLVFSNSKDLTLSSPPSFGRSSSCYANMTCY